MVNRFLFFPFTYMTKDQMKTLLAFFPTVQYLPINSDSAHQPQVEKFIKKGKIDPVFLLTDEMESIEQKIQEYMKWADIHKGNEQNLKLLFKENPYFISDSDVTAIKSQLKTRKGSSNGTPEKAHDLSREVLFLKMAQMLDQQNEDIDLELKNIDKSKHNLISTLRGLDKELDEDSGTVIPEKKDTGSMMTRERIKSWATYAAHIKEFKSDENDTFFVTTSDAVFSCIESNCKDVVNALDIDTIKVHENECENKSKWQNKFCEYLINGLKDKHYQKNHFPLVNDDCSSSGRIKVSFFSGSEINTLFNASDKQIPVCLIELK